MEKISKKTALLREKIKKLLKNHEFGENVRCHSEMLSLAIKGSRQMEPYLDFVKRLECYAFLIKHGNLGYEQIAKFERDNCDDGGRCLDWYVENYGIYISNEINKAFFVQNSCFHEDGKTEEVDFFIVKSLYSHLRQTDS